MNIAILYTMYNNNYLKLTYFFIEPTDAGIIPPQFRKPSLPINPSVVAQSSLASPLSNHALASELANSNNEKRLPHQWSSNPVEEWAKEQVRIFFSHTQFKKFS